eukprot:scaffold1214_cov311-Pavlova_lutheri.AAC.10
MPHRSEEKRDFLAVMWHVSSFATNFSEEDDVLRLGVSQRGSLSRQLVTEHQTDRHGSLGGRKARSFGTALHVRARGRDGSHAHPRRFGCLSHQSRTVPFLLANRKEADAGLKGDGFGFERET